MQEPSYRRPFSPDDFRGYFTWGKDLSDSLSAGLYHACYEDDLTIVLEKERLPLRSKWAIKLPEHGCCEVPGVWTGLNYFHSGNKYGPFLIKFPLSVLNSRKFMAFRRDGIDRNRYFFVQYEALIPIFSFEGKLWREVNPRSYFDKNNGKRLSLKRGAIYDLVLTQNLSLGEVDSIRAVSHPSCIPVKCSGLTGHLARQLLVKIAAQSFHRMLKRNGILKRMVEMFPDIEDETIEIIINK